jgi:hypothetical protein
MKLRDFVEIIALGPDKRGAFASFRTRGQVLVSSIYWDVRQAAMLSLVKIGDKSSLVKLHGISCRRGTDSVFAIEPLSFAEVLDVDSLSETGAKARLGQTGTDPIGGSQ